MTICKAVQYSLRLMVFPRLAREHDRCDYRASPGPFWFLSKNEQKIGAHEKEPNYIINLNKTRHFKLVSSSFQFKYVEKRLDLFQLLWTQLAAYPLQNQEKRSKKESQKLQTALWQGQDISFSCSPTLWTGWKGPPINCVLFTYHFMECLI